MNKIKFDPKTLNLQLILKGGEHFLLNSGHTKDKKLSKKIDRYRIEVSLACDLRCRYCVVHMNKVFQRGKMMSLKVAKKIMDKFNSEVGSRGSLILIGGEPLLNWETVKYMISKCKGRTIIFTNAYKLNREKSIFLKKYDTLILTSLDGYSLKHNKNRFEPNVKDRFSIVRKNISSAIRYGCKIGIGCVVHLENVNDVTKIAQFFTEKIKSRSLSFAYPHFTTEITKINKFPMEKYTKAMCKMVQFSKDNRVYIDQIGKLLRCILKKEIIISACKAGLSQRAFYPDGSETICTKLDTIHNYNIDNFFKKLPVNNKKCKNCIALNLCGGGCPWDASVFKNKIGVDKRVCGHNKKLVAYIIKDMEKELKNVKIRKEALGIIKDKYYPMMFPLWKKK